MNSRDTDTHPAAGEQSAILSNFSKKKYNSLHYSSIYTTVFTSRTSKSVSAIESFASVNLWEWNIWEHTEERHQFPHQLPLDRLTTSVVSTQLNKFPAFFQTSLSHHRLSTLAGEIKPFVEAPEHSCAHITPDTWRGCRCASNFTCPGDQVHSEEEKLSSSPKLVLETWTPLKRVAEEGRLLAPGARVISSAGTSECSLDKPSWQSSYDPPAMAHWCLKLSCRWTENNLLKPSSLHKQNTRLGPTKTYQIHRILIVEENVEFDKMKE